MLSPVKTQVIGSLAARSCLIPASPEAGSTRLSFWAASACCFVPAPINHAPPSHAKNLRRLKESFIGATISDENETLSHARGAQQSFLHGQVVVHVEIG